MSFFSKKTAVKKFISEVPPATFDGFGFFVDKNDNEAKYYFFDDLVKKYGPEKHDPEIPEDRNPYHVILTSVRKGFTHIEAPFTSNFIDPFVYAKRIAHMGFTGIMILKTSYSGILLRDCLLEIMTLHAKDLGFYYALAPGLPELFFKGTKDLPS